ncbi:hypothetical protein PR048_019018 [Dryococelus australis]|uniref:Integrase catalytic domain-containing protein n=1 Tax=Dryococelus australis TaxID=614101 RepID=A0ABQ9H2E7_9NEOP|nr:hypothetical protein PR048_019018 [Dryococelus australis]
MQVGLTLREEFECKIHELLGDKADRSLSMSNDHYIEIVEEIKAVDLIDMQSELDGDYTFILNYQDHFTKFVVLWPLKTKTADAVADVILDVFCSLEDPNILHSDNKREFCNKVQYLL